MIKAVLGQSGAMAINPLDPRDDRLNDAGEP